MEKQLLSGLLFLLHSCMIMKPITAEDVKRLVEHLQMKSEPLGAIVVPDDQIEQFKFDIRNALPQTTHGQGPFNTFCGVPVISESEFFDKVWKKRDYELQPSDEDVRRVLLDQVLRHNR